MAHAATVHKLHASRDEEEYEERYEWDKERGDAMRPFRLWDAEERKNIRYRFYADKQRAHTAAMIEARWSHIGKSIEVYDCRTGKLLGQYTRRVDSIRFAEG